MKMPDNQTLSPLDHKLQEILELNYWGCAVTGVVLFNIVNWNPNDLWLDLSFVACLGDLDRSSDRIVTTMGIAVRAVIGYRQDISNDEIGASNLIKINNAHFYLANIDSEDILLIKAEIPPKRQWENISHKVDAKIKELRQLKQNQPTQKQIPEEQKPKSNIQSLDNDQHSVSNGKASDEYYLGRKIL